MSRPSRIQPPKTQPPRMGGIALKNGVVVISERYWAAAVRNTGGDISVASGRKPRLPGGGLSGHGGRGGLVGHAGARGFGRGGVGRGGVARGEAGWGGEGGEGVPLLRGLSRFGESLLVLAEVKIKLPQAELPLEGGRVAGALIGSIAATSAVKALAPRSALVQETGIALAAFVPAVLALKNSRISGYHGAEHKVIGGREAALRSTRPSPASGAVPPGWAPGAVPDAPGSGAVPLASQSGREAHGEAAATSASSRPRPSASAAAAKEHDRCGSNLVGPYLLATVATNLLVRGRSGRKAPAASAIAGAVSLGAALEALRWATRNGDSILARLLLLPGRALQRSLTTTEPTAEQLEVGERALAELLRLEEASG